MIDNNAFRNISYGLFLVSSHSKDVTAGCVVNTFAQVTSQPLQVSLTLNKDNHTTQAVLESGRYVVTCLAEDAPMELIGMFGFKRSREVNKFESFNSSTDSYGIRYVTDHALARFSVQVSHTFDLGTHLMFIGSVEEAEVLAHGKPLTYAHYHEIKGGKTPPRASSFNAELHGGAAQEKPLKQANEATATSTDPTLENRGAAEAKVVEANVSSSNQSFAWRCTVCGHIEYVDELPGDFVCPICGVGRDKFERIVV